MGGADFQGLHRTFFFFIDLQRILSHRQSLKKQSGGDIEWSGPELLKLPDGTEDTTVVPVTCTKDLADNVKAFFCLHCLVRLDAALYIILFYRRKLPATFSILVITPAMWFDVLLINT